jgi:hypothetical protein
VAVVRSLVEVIALPILKSSSEDVTEIMSRATHMQLQGIALCHKPTAKRIGYFADMVQTSARGSANDRFAI